MGYCLRIPLHHDASIFGTNIPGYEEEGTGSAAVQRGDITLDIHDTVVFRSTTC